MANGTDFITGCIIYIVWHFFFASTTYSTYVYVYFPGVYNIYQSDRLYTTSVWCVCVCVYSTRVGCKYAGCSVYWAIRILWWTVWDAISFEFSFLISIFHTLMCVRVYAIDNDGWFVLTLLCTYIVLYILKQLFASLL